MNRQPHTAVREKIVAKAIEEVATELRLVDIADYVAFIRLERFATIADIVESACELFFQPGTLTFGHGGTANVDWSGNPEIILDMQLKPKGVTVYFTLRLSDLSAAVDVNYVAFDESREDPEENSRFLEATLAESRLQPRAPSYPGHSALAR